MADDYLSGYRQFFEKFAQVTLLNDPLPFRVASYDLTAEELDGEIMEYSLQYLSQKDCPPSLLIPLTRIVVEEVRQDLKQQQHQPVYQPLKLMQQVTGKVNDICLRYTDNEQVSSLPAPVDNETLVSSYAIKHTRRKMEDRHISLPSFNQLHNVTSPQHSNIGYYAVFDGHNGTDAATYSVSHLHQYLAQSKHYPHDPVNAFREAYEKTEHYFNSKNLKSGTTAVAILHDKTTNKLVVSWLGDSQAILVGNGNYIQLVNPHKPERPDETKRIQMLNGFVVDVEGMYRVNGQLAVSRAIGDKQYKPYVSAEPDLRCIQMDGNEDFIVIGCDGLWDFCEPKQVIETVYFQITEKPDHIESVSRRLVDLAKENGSTDNITVIVVFLTEPKEIIKKQITGAGQWPTNIMDSELQQDHQHQQQPQPHFDTKNPFSSALVVEGGGGNNNKQNGIYRNFDDDFGPETNVDAVDDILLSPAKLSNDLNPFNDDHLIHDRVEIKDDLVEKQTVELVNLNDHLNQQQHMLLETINENTSTDNVVIEETTPQCQNVQDLLEIYQPVVEEVEEEEVASKCNGQQDNNEPPVLVNNNPFSNEEEDLLSNNIVEELQNKLPSETPALCSVINTLEEEAELSEKNLLMEDPTAITTQLLSPVISGGADNIDFKLSPVDPACDLIVAESVGEGEESDDDEWNYIKGPGTPDKPTELVCTSPVEESRTMTSPLNPDAAEFVPVHSPTEMGSKTPVKNIPPPGLDDLIASSPNWSQVQMEHVQLPDEKQFLTEIKTRPSGLFDDETQRTSGSEFGDDVELQKTPAEPVEVQKQVQEPSGIELATDMISSFIDPSTISSDTQQTEDVLTVVEAPVVDVLSPVLSPVQSPVSPVSPVLSPLAPETPKSTLVEAPTSSIMFSPDSDATQPPISQVETNDNLVELAEPAQVVPTPPSTPLVETQPPAQPEQIVEAVEKLTVVGNNVEAKEEEKVVEAAPVAVAAAVAATTASVAAAASVTNKTDDKKDTKKPTSTKPTAAKAKPTQAKPAGASSTVASRTTASAAAKRTPVAPTTAARLASATAAKTTPAKTTARTATPSTGTATPRTTLAARAAKPASSEPAKTSTAAPARPATNKLASTTTAAAGAAAKPKPRVPLATVDKKPATTAPVNGTSKPAPSAAKRTEVKKSPVTTTAPPRLGTTRPATAPVKSATARTTSTVTKTTTTGVTNGITAASRVRSATTTTAAKPAGTTTATAVKKTTVTKTAPSDKQAKELANKTTAKTNGVANGRVTAVKRTAPTATSKTVSKVKTTEAKTEVQEVVEGAQVVQDKKEDNLIEINQESFLINGLTV